MNQLISLYYTAIARFIIIITVMGLLKIYIDSYKKINMGYTIGLIFFGLTLLLKNITSLVYMVFAQDIYDIIDVIESTFELIAILILYKITKDS